VVLSKADREKRRAGGRLRHSKERPTPRERELLGIVRAHSRPLTMRQLARLHGVRSSSSVYFRLQSLCAQGLVEQRGERYFPTFAALGAGR